jgi:hypothetical protein
MCITESKEYFLGVDKLEFLCKRKEAYQELKSSLILGLSRYSLALFHSFRQLGTTTLAIVLVGRVIVVALGTLHG